MHLHAEMSFLLNEDALLTIERIVSIEKKGMVLAVADWQGKTVMVHAFLASKRGIKKAKRESKGISWLRECGILTPVHYGTFRVKQWVMNIFEYIEEAKTLPECLSPLSHPIAEASVNLLKKIMVELATHHVFGVLQRVPHPRDFLITEEKIVVTQGENIIRKKMLLSKRSSLQSLADFFVLLKLNDFEYCRCFLKEYADARGWNIKEKDFRFMERRIGKQFFVPALFRFLGR